MDRLVLVLIHVANTLLIYRLAKRLLNSGASALVAGIIFGGHPIQNEAVAWIAAFPDVLLTSVVLSTLLWFAHLDAAPASWADRMDRCAVFLGAADKGTGAMLVPLLAGYEFLYLGRTAALPNPGCVVRFWRIGCFTPP